jgi:hypothetical protein
MAVRILSYHQVMPGYLDFISVFGSQTKPRDLRFSGFREQTLLSTPPRGLVAPELGRSGRQFQLCYNVKSVFCLSSTDTPLQKKEWSIRQAAIHHQFDVVEGTTLWIMTKGNLDFKNRVQDMTGRNGRPEDRAFGTTEECFKSSLAIHLMCCHWSTEEWRWYIQWLEDVIDEDVSASPGISSWIEGLTSATQTEIAVVESRGKEFSRHEYTPDDLLAVQRYEDKTNEATMILAANIDVITALRKYYEGLMTHKDFLLKKECEENVLAFSTQLNYMIYDLNMQISRAKLLVKITEDRKSIVSRDSCVGNSPSLQSPCNT